MKQYAILTDTATNTPYGIVVKDGSSDVVYGAHKRAEEWARWANGQQGKSLLDILPVGIALSPHRPLPSESSTFIAALMSASEKSGDSLLGKREFMGSHKTNAPSSTPSGRDFQLRSFDVSMRQNAVNFKALAFQYDIKSRSIAALLRTGQYGYNIKTGLIRGRRNTDSSLAIQNRADSIASRAIQRKVGLSDVAYKYSVKGDAFADIEEKRLGGRIGKRIGRGLRSAPDGFVFIDVTGRIDADKDGIVFEGLPLERPIIPRFLVPQNLGRAISSMLEGESEENETLRRAGKLGDADVSRVEGRIRELLGNDAASLTGADGRTFTPSVPGRATTEQSRRAVISNRVGRLSRVGKGGKSQIDTRDSRAVEKLTWDDDNKELIVTYNGGRVYTYSGVDDKWVRELENNPEFLGRTLNEIKKQGYPFVQGGDHAPDRTLRTGLQRERELAGMRSQRGGEDVDTTKLVPEANLEGADLSEDDLSNIDVSYANLSGADLNRSTFFRASFQGANLSNADMVDAWLEEANLYRANLQNAKMSGIYGRRADFSDTDLRGADLSNADLVRADLRGADLTGANLQGADLTGADLRGAIFKDANLNGAELDKGWEQIVGMRSRRGRDDDGAGPDSDETFPMSIEDILGDEGFDRDPEDMPRRRRRRSDSDSSRSQRGGYRPPAETDEQLERHMQDWFDVLDGTTTVDDPVKKKQIRDRYFAAKDELARRKRNELRAGAIARGTYRDTSVRSRRGRDDDGAGPDSDETFPMSIEDILGDEGFDRDPEEWYKDSRGRWRRRSWDQNSQRSQRSLRNEPNPPAQKELNKMGSGAEAKRNLALRDLNQFSRDGNNPDSVYPGAEAFDVNNPDHGTWSDYFEDVDYPDGRVQDFLNARHVLRERFGPDADEKSIDILAMDISNSFWDRWATSNPTLRKRQAGALSRLIDFNSRAKRPLDVYPGAEVFDVNNDDHVEIADIFEDADYPAARVQDFLNARQALRDEMSSDIDKSTLDTLAMGMAESFWDRIGHMSLSKRPDDSSRSRRASYVPASNFGSTVETLDGIDFNALRRHNEWFNRPSRRKVGPTNARGDGFVYLADGRVITPKEVRDYFGYDNPQSMRSAYTGPVIGNGPLPSFKDLDGMTRVSGPLGSNGGQWYRDDKTGRKFFVKPTPTPNHAYNEAAVAAVYRAAGAHAPNVAVIVDGKGKPHIISEGIDGLETLGRPDARQRAVAKLDMGIDMALSNWDVYGGGENTKWDGNTGAAIRLDTGGGGLYRARGGDKPSFNPNDPWVEPATMIYSQGAQSKYLYGNVSNDDFVTSMRRVESLNLAAIDKEMADSGVPAAMRKTFIDTLAARQKMAKKYADDFSQYTPEARVNVAGTKITPGGERVVKTPEKRGLSIFSFKRGNDTPNSRSRRGGSPIDEILGDAGLDDPEDDSAELEEEIRQGMAIDPNLYVDSSGKWRDRRTGRIVRDVAPESSDSQRSRRGSGLSDDDGDDFPQTVEDILGDAAFDRDPDDWVKVNGQWRRRRPRRTRSSDSQRSARSYAERNRAGIKKYGDGRVSKGMRPNGEDIPESAYNVEQISRRDILAGRNISAGLVAAILSNPNRSDIEVDPDFSYEWTPDDRQYFSGFFRDEDGTPLDDDGVITAWMSPNGRLAGYVIEDNKYMNYEKGFSNNNRYNLEGESDVAWQDPIVVEVTHADGKILPDDERYAIDINENNIGRFYYQELTTGMRSRRGADGDQEKDPIQAERDFEDLIGDAGFDRDPEDVPPGRRRRRRAANTNNFRSARSARPRSDEPGLRNNEIAGDLTIGEYYALSDAVRLLQRDDNSPAVAALRDAIQNAIAANDMIVMTRADFADAKRAVDNWMNNPDNLPGGFVSDLQGILDEMEIADADGNIWTSAMLEAEGTRLPMPSARSARVSRGSVTERQRIATIERGTSMRSSGLKSPGHSKIADDDGEIWDSLSPDERIEAAARMARLEDQAIRRLVGGNLSVQFDSNGDVISVENYVDGRLIPAPGINREVGIFSGDLKPSLALDGRTAQKTVAAEGRKAKKFAKLKDYELITGRRNEATNETTLALTDEGLKQLNQRITSVRKLYVSNLAELDKDIAVLEKAIANGTDVNKNKRALVAKKGQRAKAAKAYREFLDDAAALSTLARARISGNNNNGKNEDGGDALQYVPEHLPSTYRKELFKPDGIIGAKSTIDSMFEEWVDDIGANTYRIPRNKNQSVSRKSKEYKALRKKFEDGQLDGEIHRDIGNRWNWKDKVTLEDGRLRPKGKEFDAMGAVSDDVLDQDSSSLRRLGWHFADVSEETGTKRTGSNFWARTFVPEPRKWIARYNARNARKRESARRLTALKTGRGAVASTSDKREKGKKELRLLARFKAKRLGVISSGRNDVDGVVDSANKQVALRKSAVGEDGSTITPDGIDLLSRLRRLFAEADSKEAQKIKKKQAGLNPGDDPILTEIFNSLSLNERPTVVTLEELEELAKLPGARVIRRGVGGKTFAEDYLDDSSVRRFTPKQGGTAQGVGEYWAVVFEDGRDKRAAVTKWEYLVTKDDQKDRATGKPLKNTIPGPGSVVATLAPDARVMTMAEAEALQTEIAAVSGGINLAFASPDLPERFAQKTEGDALKRLLELIDANLEARYKADDPAWQTRGGKTVMGLVNAVRNARTPEERKRALAALDYFARGSTREVLTNLLAPLYGYDAIRAGDGVLLVFNRGAVMSYGGVGGLDMTRAVEAAVIDGVPLSADMVAKLHAGERVD